MLTSNGDRVQADGGLVSWSDVLIGQAGVRSPERGKRAFDVTVSCGALVGLAPVLLLIALVIKLNSRGGVIHVSRRMGRNGRVFECLKFRTLRADGTLTGAGRVLKRFGLDELPQLVNVLRGEMSVVGPRPVLAGEPGAGPVARYRRFELLPGITGLWAMRDLSPTGAYISLDEVYVAHWSVSQDLAITMRTVGAALLGWSR